LESPWWLICILCKKEKQKHITKCLFYHTNDNHSTTIEQTEALSTEIDIYVLYREEEARNMSAFVDCIPLYTVTTATPIAVAMTIGFNTSMICRGWNR
jgi:hypothetical protein